VKKLVIVVTFAMLPVGLVLLGLSCATQPVLEISVME